MMIVTGTELPAPLAEDAATARTTAGPCSICRHQILRGERYAITVPARRLAHVSCIALAAAALRRRVPVIR